MPSSSAWLPPDEPLPSRNARSAPQRSAARSSAWRGHPVLLARARARRRRTAAARPPGRAGSASAARPPRWAGQWNDTVDRAPIALDRLDERRATLVVVGGGAGRPGLGRTGRRALPGTAEGARVRTTRRVARRHAEPAWLRGRPGRAPGPRRVGLQHEDQPHRYPLAGWQRDVVPHVVEHQQPDLQQHDPAHRDGGQLGVLQARRVDVEQHQEAPEAGDQPAR